MMMTVAIGHAQQQMGLGFQMPNSTQGLLGGMNNCGYSMSMGNQLQKNSQQPLGNQSEIKETQAEIKELNKEKSSKKKELLKAQRELQGFDMKLRTIFDSESYDFLKEHFESEHRCQDYKGYATEEGSAQISFPNKKLAKDWSQICDVENNSKAQIKTTICSRDYLLRVKDSSCASTITQYPQSRHQVEVLKKEIEELDQNISSLKENLKEAQNSKGADGGMGADMLARDASETEGGVCLECMNRGSASGGGNRGGSTNLTSLVSNSVMAMMAYNSTNNFYSNMADKNSELGFPTAMPNTSPFMAASPYLMGVLSAGFGNGSFGCAGSGAGSFMSAGTSFGGGASSGLGAMIGAGATTGFGSMIGVGSTAGIGSMIGVGASSGIGSLMGSGIYGVGTGMNFGGSSGLGTMGLQGQSYYPSMYSSYNTSLQSQLYGLNQRLPYLQNPYSVNSVLYGR